MAKSIALFASIVWVAACGASALKTHARAATGASQALSEFQRKARDKRLSEQNQAIDQLRAAARDHGRQEPFREDARAAVDAVRERWAPFVAAYNVVAAAHRLWTDWLLVYVERDKVDGAKLYDLVRELVVAWANLSEAARHLGLNLPPPPDAVLRIKSQQEE